jgi:flagellar biosynthetic protein FliR
VNHSTDLLNSAAITSVVLFAFRVGGLVLIAPVFSGRTVPATVRTVVVVLVTWLLAPVAVVAGSVPELSPATCATETLVGFGMGLGAAVFVGAMDVMGDLVAITTGLSGAAALDPLTNQSSAVLGQFANLFAVSLMLAVNAQQVMLRALAESVRLIPVGGPVHLETGLPQMLSLGSTLFWLGFRFAAPVVAVVLLANAALAILARVAPQLNVLSVAFPLQIGVGLLALAATVPLIGDFYSGWGGAYQSLVTNVMGALAGSGGH